MLIPEYIDPEAWNAYCDMRRMMGKQAPFTEHAEKLTLRKLEDFYRQGYDPNHVLETSIERSWRGVFLTNDTPRRQLTQTDRANVARVESMLKVVGK